MFSKQAVALALAVATAEAAYQGFNYGSTNVDGSSKYEADFKTEFQTAKNLVGTDNGFTSARLYTMIQGGTTADPIQAIPAAIAEDTSLLLGLWASGGNMANEITALKAAISAYGSSFGDKVVGISVGSEDMYRNSVTGSKSNAGPGLEPEVLVEYIKEVRAAIAGTSLSGASIGHVDTWDAWTNSSNAAVVDALDWLGFDGYPFYQLTDSNSIDNAKALFDESVARTQAIANGKEVWITETGWPVSGPSENEAVASIANAQQYWDQVACPLLGQTNTWWYLLADAGASTSFGVSSSTSDTTPLYNLRCNTTSSTSSSSAAASSATGSSSGSAAGSSTGSSSGSVMGGSTGSSSGSAAGSSTGSSSGPAAGSSTGSSSGPAAGSSTGSSSGSAAGSSTGSSSGSAAGSSTGSSSGSAMGGSTGSSSGSAMGSSTSGGIIAAHNGTRPVGFHSTVSSTPLASATKAASTSGSSSGSGSSASGSSFGAGSNFGTSSSASASSSPVFNSATRSTGSAFGAIVAAIFLGIAV
ncbi:glucan endo-1-3-beta-glucosidase eglC [Penicillium maclennaniae]|uniref:glucan endo-1-3-beta-glucosidase eglC n=1 Tax=Penicillium maclennaniae TaxID=1343394 RepID=UPI0025409B56|nr:glucan endo-1-3-beta-glucosidase eglC [Penicillium maclennaniae]KAJ5666331.1 glucan endo-1-3-beta-glucosidase eglC [Penicillium maclennaniae]